MEIDLRTGEIVGKTSGRRFNIDPVTGKELPGSASDIPASWLEPWQNGPLCAEPQAHYFSSKGGLYSSPFEMSTVNVRKATGTPKPMCHTCRQNIPNNVTVPTGR